MEPRARASTEQYATLVEYMERHGDLARPQSAAQGRARSDQLWSELALLLNSIGSGVPKPVEKWKKVWADWKTKTKSKALNIKKHASGTGGGPHTKLRLNVLEERVLAVMGVGAVAGQPNIEERGLSQTQSEQQAQIQRTFASSDFDNGFSVEDWLFRPISHSTAPTPEPQPGTSSAPAREQPEPRPGTSSAPAREWLEPRPGPSSAPEPVPARTSPTAATVPDRQAGQAATRAPAPRRASPQRRRATTPSVANSSPRRVPRARRRLTLTPFDRAVNEFVSVENRRLQFEETREKNWHEREMERLRLESERLQVDRERVEAFRSVTEVGRALLAYLTSKDDTIRLNVTND